MKEQSEGLVEPYQQKAILKENKYKKVSLITDSEGQQFICKTYRGREQEYCEMNAKYAFEMLAYFYRHFSDISKIPNPVALKKSSVILEYLPSLPSAAILDARSIPVADKFFRRCYEINKPTDPIRSIEQSVYFTPLMKTWLDSGEPLSLGLKGDLWQNLCYIDDGLVLADIDSAAIEPLGLSELVMHAEIHAELSLSNSLYQIFSRPTQPICFGVLNITQSRALIEMALQFVSLRMEHLPSFVRRSKIRLARRSIESTLVN